MIAVVAVCPHSPLLISVLAAEAAALVRTGDDDRHRSGGYAAWGWAS